jgi:O-antigen/teichoic acid export membrane protein
LNRSSDSSPDSFIDAVNLRDELRIRSVRGGTAMMGAQASRFVLNLVAVGVLARLLTPDDFGLIAMVVTVTGFISMFKDMGLSMATVQRDRIEHAQVSALFWIILAFSGLIAIATALSAPVVAWFYGDPRLLSIVPVFALGFICSGLTVQHQALLKRRMLFSALAATEMSGIVVGVVVGIGMALRGFGFWSLVGKQLGEQVGIMVGVWVACHWRPSRPGGASGLRSMLFFGRDMAGFNVLSYVSRNLDNVLLGWRLGPAMLGVYNEAYRLLYLPIQQINSPVSSVAIPALSRLQHEPERYREYYRKGLGLVVALGMPAVGFMLAAADEIVLVVLGSQWLMVIPVFRLLGPAAFVGTFNMAAGWVYVSLGQTGRQLRWQLIGAAGMGTAFVIGLQWGVTGMAAACSIATLLLRYPALVFCYRGAPVGMADLFHALWRPTLASLGSAGLLWGAGQLALADVHPGLRLLVGAALYALFYLSAWLLLPGGRQWMRNSLRLVGDLRGGAEGGEEGRQ